MARVNGLARLTHANDIAFKIIFCFFGVYTIARRLILFSEIHGAAAAKV
jgi:hypothetical protein